MSRPTSPRRRLDMISTSSAARTGSVDAAQTQSEYAPRPNAANTKPSASPAAGMATSPGLRSISASFVMFARSVPSLVGDVQNFAARLAMHRVGFVPCQAAFRAGVPHLVRPQHRARQREEQRHAEDHDDDGN